METSNDSFPTSLTPVDFVSDETGDLEISNDGAYFSGMVSFETVLGENYAINYKVRDCQKKAPLTK